MDRFSSESPSEGSTSDSEKEDDTQMNKQDLKLISMEKNKVLYQAGIILQNAIKYSPGMKGLWPPTATSLNNEAAKAVVPPELYNVIAWSVGTASDPSPDLSSFVDVEEDVHLKLLSLCQDILYLSSRGKKQTPKSLALGLTVRHLTGSTQVGNILSKLGHCASVDTVVGLETSLAELQLLGPGIPPGFEEKKPTVLVWDNIDFGEETLSGHGTTHHTNGIMVQCQTFDVTQTKPRTI